MIDKLINSVFLFLFFFLSPLGITEVISCADLLGMNVDIPDGPYCDGDIITIEVMGYYIGGGITTNVNEDYSFFGGVDFISEQYDKVKIRLDASKENKLSIRYHFEIEEGMYEEYQYCSITEVFTFDVFPAVNEDEVSIKWEQGDILNVEGDVENVCYQWGEIINEIERDIEGANGSTFYPNSSTASFFINTIKDKKPIPKDKFDYDFYVRVFDCDMIDSHCSTIIYFTSENFDYVDFLTHSENQEIEYNIYPNPGNGIINISSSGILQNSTPFPTIVTDVHGNPLPTSDLIHAWDGTYIDISAVPVGVYFVYFKTGEKTFEKYRYVKH